MMSFAAAVLAKVTVTTALALCGVRLARRSRAAVRHVVLATAFAVLLILPIVSIVAPSIRVAVPIAVQEAVSVPVDALIEATAIGGAALPAPAPVNSAPSSSRPPLLALLAAGWILGTAIFLLPVILGLWQVRSLRRSGIPWREGRTVVEALAVEAGIRRPVGVFVHEAVPGPMTCGLLEPDVVLPTDARIWPEEDLRRAIVHELEHVRRADWLSQCLARTVCALYWFHPLVWIAWRQLSLEAERACDDAVLRKAEAADYADQLVVLARRLAAGPGQAQLAMANRADLATRVVAVLDSHQRRGRAGVRWVSFAIAASALLITAISPLRVVADQTPSGPPAVTQKYEVASIRPCRTEEAPPGPARGGAGGTNASISPGRFTVPCVTVEQLIYLAYAGTGATKTEWLANDDLGTASDSTKVRGGPAWVHSQKDKYAIEATAPGASDRSVLMGSMLRSLLEERFQLKIHRDTEEVPMYAMTVVKSGFKLQPMKDGDCEPFDPSAPPEGRDFNANKPQCGNMTMGARGPNASWRFSGFAVRSIAARLSRALDRHVIDQTGIEGEYIIRLEFHPDENTPGIKWPPERDADTSAPQAASIFTALEQQLGLKIEKTRGPRGFLVIDRIERPTPNDR